MIDTRNIETLIGKNVIGSDGDKIGSVGQIYVDTSSGQPTWASVSTGLFGTSESFVPLADASDADGELRVGYEKAFVKDAPRVDPDQGLSFAEEDELYSYYGLNNSSTTPDTEVVTDTTTTYDTTDGLDGTDRTDTDADSTTTRPDPTDDFDTTTTHTGSTDDFDTTTKRTDTADGYDTSGPTTDDAMTRSEEQLRVGTEKVESGRARLRKYVVTENETVTVPVSHEEVRLEREPITDANVGEATSGPDISEEEHEIVLTEERVVVDKETVPVERVTVGTETITEEQQVNEEVRKEQIELDGDTTTTNDGSRTV